MRFSSVLNVIAQDAGPLAARLRSFGEIAWLAEGRAFDIGFDGDPDGVLQAALAAAGDLPARYARLLRELGVVGKRQQPMCHGVAQGLIGWLLDADQRHEASLPTTEGGGA